MRSQLITKLRQHPTPRARLLPIAEQRRRARLDLPDRQPNGAGVVLLAMLAVLGGCFVAAVGWAILRAMVQEPAGVRAVGRAGQ